MHKTTQTESAHITRRLIACMPASRFEMHTLTRLAGIETSRSLPTAAVECKRRPRLLINPDFVASHCQRDEHLFLLVMHELWHVMLAHTRMYPRATPAQNIAFDAVINSGLMREFNKPEYMGFFDAINPADQFPGCLLRPPVGWPLSPEYPEDVGPPGTAAILKRLYPPLNAGRNSGPLYEEILNLLIQAGMFSMPILIGSHNGDSPLVHDPHMKEIMRQISNEWPAIPFDGNGIGGRGLGGMLSKRTYRVADSSENARRVFAQTLQVCVGARPGRERRKAKVPIPAQGGNGVLPNARDRLAPARRLLGAPETMWAQPTTARARLTERPSRSFVYLDVSGSMNFVLSNLLHLLLPYVANKQAEVFQFSTDIKPLPFAELKQGLVTTTGGTDINCVLAHALEVSPQVERVLILTDGETGSPSAHLYERIKERRMKLYVVLPNGCKLDDGVWALSTAVVILPPIG